MREAHILRKAKQAEAQQLKQKALEPQERYCYIQKMKVNILVEYPDYKNPYVKGPEGAIYCENILQCYQADIRCRYSGISPLFRDPFMPTDEDLREEEERRKAEEEQADEEAHEEPSEEPLGEPSEDPESDPS